MNIISTLCVDEKKWVKVKPTGYQPHGRRSHCAVRYSEDKVLLFGGYNAGNKRHFNDVFIYDSCEWWGTVRSCDYRSCDSRKILQIFMLFLFSGHRHIIEVQPFGVPPIPRRRCGYSIASNEVIFCGGTRWAGTSGWSFNDFCYSPTERMIDGKKKLILHDHDDTFILSLCE